MSSDFITPSWQDVAERWKQAYEDVIKGVRMVDDVMLWCFDYFFHMDKANACMHNAPVKFSPITFRLMDSLMETWNPDKDITQEMAEVRYHKGQYELDPGR